MREDRKGLTYMKIPAVRKRKKGFSTRYEWTKGSQVRWLLLVASSFTHTFPAWNMVARPRNGPQFSEGLILHQRNMSEHVEGGRKKGGSTNLITWEQRIRISKWLLNSRPHGIGDTHWCTQERWEAEEGNEEGGHLTRPPCLSGSLTVHHQTCLHDRVCKMFTAYI